MSLLALALLAAAPFPLPTLDDKPLAVTAGQTTFRLPMKFQKVRAFYEARLGGEPTVRQELKRTGSGRVLTLTNRDRSGVWRSATVTEKELETVITVVPVLRADEETISGQATPLVQFVIGRSPDVKKAVESIDHTAKLRE